MGKADSFVDDAVGISVGNILGLEEGVLPEKSGGKKKIILVLQLKIRISPQC